MKQAQLEIAAARPSGRVPLHERTLVTRRLKEFKLSTFAPQALECSWPYFAGFFDADGSITVGTHRHSLHLSLLQKNPFGISHWLDFLHRQGHTCWYLRHTERGASLACGELATCRKSLELLLENGLLVKKEQAALAMTLTEANHKHVREAMFKFKGHQNRYQRLDEAGMDRAKHIHQKVQKLHSRASEQLKARVQEELQVLRQEHNRQNLICKANMLRADIRRHLREGVTKLARERRLKQKENPEPTADWGKPPPKPPAHQSKESNTGRRAGLDRKFVKALEPSLAHRLQDAREAWGSMRQRARLARPPVVHEPEPEEPVSRVPSKPSSEPEAPRAREQQPQQPQPAPPPEAPTTPVEQEKTEPDKERAVELFRSFVAKGREAQNWRKNDLRLINSFVVPWLFGSEARIDWAHPVLALDELEQLVKEAPEQIKLLGAAPKKSNTQAPYAPVPAPPAPTTPSATAPTAPAARPPLPSRIRSPPGGATSGRAEVDEGQPVARRCGTGDLPRRPKEETTSRVARSASPAPVTSHQEAIRARREALEMARQESLKKALAKKEFGHREDEIASLEAQMHSASTYAAAGLKRRLQTLKASQLGDGGTPG
ncbi:unnamed protein product [Cladocopium goreaui]|uniref:Kinesin-like protein n=1 Tax=Cladocopium goreaui TaxID=2562237 RepID=A0A9P1CF88_9DINO|nr:unnamed protein product [Cladocopium goreaui]